jgi:hypothetical protein
MANIPWLLRILPPFISHYCMNVRVPDLALPDGLSKNLKLGRRADRKTYR